MSSFNRKNIRGTRRQAGGIRLGDVVFVAVILGAVFLVDWGGVLGGLSFGSSADESVALTNLQCDIREGRPLPSGFTDAPTASVTGAVKNIGEDPVRLSVRIDYIIAGNLADHRMSGTRIERVNPSPLSQNSTGTFRFEETVDRYFPGTDCQVRLRDDDANRWIAFEDRT